MSKVLISFSKDWADEFDVYGFKVYDWVEWYRLETALRVIGDKYIGWYFGTNEGWDDDTINMHLDDFDITDLSDTDAMVLKNLFDNEFGNFPCLEDWLTGCTEEAEEE